MVDSGEAGMDVELFGEWLTSEMRSMDDDDRAGPRPLGGRAPDARITYGGSHRYRGAPYSVEGPNKSATHQGLKFWPPECRKRFTATLGSA